MTPPTLPLRRLEPTPSETAKASRCYWRKEWKAMRKNRDEYADALDRVLSRKFTFELFLALGCLCIGVLIPLTYAWFTL